ncbi:MAG: hypothetical protein Q8M16_19255 [Pirellulaceae bacterium]|nr:hypothetical protein [Pirellulaceae bacterium]
MTKNKLISAYTPSNTDPQLLKRVFVQREQLLDRIVDRLSVSMTSGDKHHLLLVGPRGSGKTHLVTLAHWELRQNPKLSDSMRIAWLGEDDTFSGLIHFAFGIARSLADEYPDEFPADFKSSVRGLRQDDAALAVLNSVITNLKHRHLLLITENLDHTFQGLGESGQKKLRAFLQETRRIATLATTQQLFAGVSSRDEAFFGFFDTFHLEPLTVDDAQQLILNIAKEQGSNDLIQFLNSNNARYRIRALHHLAGGNHRMYVLLAEFLTQDKLNDLVAAFENLAEEMTPYFQERMRSLPDQQRQLVQCLCDAEGAMTVKQLVEETFIAEGNCSKQLGNLKAKAYVRSEKRGKESYYDIAEPLMRLCLEVKNQRGRPLKLVASFLKAWFPEDKLQASLKAVEDHSRVAEYCQLALQCDHSFESLLNSKLKAEIEQKEGEKTLEDYGGTPGDLISMILQRGPSEWAGYVSVIAPLYIEDGVADKLGKGITQSIQFLDEGDYSPAQLDLWYQAWSAFGDDADELQIPLQCLHAAIEVLKSDPPNDRPLFRLPLEIRQLVRPLLQKKLNETLRKIPN